jgi:hypothetical protein
LGLPVKNEIAAMAIPITESSGRMTVVSLSFSPISEDSSPANAKSERNSDNRLMQDKRDLFFKITIHTP